MNNELRNSYNKQQEVLLEKINKRFGYEQKNSIVLQEIITNVMDKIS